MVRFFKYGEYFYPIIDGDKNRLLTLGRAIKRQIATCTNPLNSSFIQDVFRNVTSLIRSSSSDCVVLPHGLAHCVLAELHVALSSKYYIVFVVSCSGNGQPGFGIVPKSRVPLSHPKLWSNPDCISSAKKALDAALTANCMLTTITLEELNFEVQNTICEFLTRKLDDIVANITLEYLENSNHSHESKKNLVSDFSYSMWEWIYQRSVIQVPLGHDVCASLKNPNLICELREEEFVDFGNRQHALMSYSTGRVYFWPGSPFLFSSKFGFYFFSLINLLMSKFLWLHAVQDVLLTLYSEDTSHLNFHQDVFDEKPEMVILFFVGEERDLIVKAKSFGQFEKIISCSSNKCIILTPLANTLLLHAKSTATTPNSELSLSIAFRNGLSVFQASRQSSTLRRKFDFNKRTLKKLAHVGL